MFFSGRNKWIASVALGVLLSSPLSLADSYCQNGGTACRRTSSGPNPDSLGNIISEHCFSKVGLINPLCYAVYGLSGAALITYSVIAGPFALFDGENGHARKEFVNTWNGVFEFLGSKPGENQKSEKESGSLSSVSDQSVMALKAPSTDASISGEQASPKRSEADMASSADIYSGAD